MTFWVASFPAGSCPGSCPSTPQASRPRPSHGTRTPTKRLHRFLGARDLAADAAGIRAFLAAERERTSAWSSQRHYRNLSVYFRWLTGEGEIAENPMGRVEKPQGVS
jgi:site-specific recombinase XerD